MEGFFNGVGNTFMTLTGILLNPGVWVVILVIWLFFWLQLKKERGMLAAILIIIVSMVLVRWLAPEAVRAFNGGVADSNDAWQETCRQAGTCLNDITKFGSGLPESQPQQSGIPQNFVGGQPTAVLPTVQPTPVVVRTWNPNGLILMTDQWVTNPPNWPSTISGQMLGPGQVPKGIKLTFSSDNYKGVFNNPIAEIWTITVTDTSGNLNPVTLLANGYFVRDSKTFNVQNSGVSISGAGTMEAYCPMCFTDTVLATPTPVPTTVPTVAPTVAGPANGTQIKFSSLVCGYWGWQYVGGVWYAVSTLNGAPNFALQTSEAYARNACPQIPAHP